MERCTRCVLPKSYPKLAFDKEGVCYKCKRNEKSLIEMDYHNSEKILQKMFIDIKKTKRKYDCVIGLSGGKDSCQVAYLAVKEYELNPLCVTFDNGMLSQEARDNVKTIVQYLNVDHIFYKPDEEIMKRLYRHFLFLTGEFCTPCNVGINSATYGTALKYHIPSLLTGYSTYTDAEPDINIYTPMSEYFKNVVKGHFTEDELKDFPVIGNIARGWNHLTKKVLHIEMPRYVKWEEKEFIENLRKIGWTSNHKSETEHTDCAASPLKEYLHIKEFGFSEKAMKYSKLVRNNYVTREEALSKVEAFEAGIMEAEEKHIQNFKRLFDVPEDALNEIVKQRQARYIPKKAVLIDHLVTNEALMRKLIYRY